MDISELLGKVLTKITVNNDRDEIRFFTQEGDEYRMFHQQNCCESVVIDDIVGDLEDLIGHPILKAEESFSTDSPKGYTYGENGEYTSYDDSHTWTFYHLATIKGYVDIKWYGSSNGYYSEGVDFVKEGTQDEYGYYPN